jgi:hypothetical protein
VADAIYLSRKRFGAKTDGTGKARSALIATPRARFFSDQYRKG